MVFINILFAELKFLRTLRVWVNAYTTQLKMIIFQIIILTSGALVIS